MLAHGLDQVIQCSWAGELSTPCWGATLLKGFPWGKHTSAFLYWGTLDAAESQGLDKGGCTLTPL